MSTHLTAGQKALLTAALTQRQSQLRRRLSEHLGGVGGAARVEHARDVLQQDGDDATQRDADREVDLALSDLESRELAAVEAAIGRLQRPEYGLCVDCGEAVPFDRLRLEPWALRCVSCESLREGYLPHASTI